MKAMIIPGGVPQVELIKQLKNRGIVTVLVDGSPDAVARPYADVFYKENIFDVSAVKELAEKEKVDFLLTVCADQVLLVVAQVSEMLGLPCYIDYKTAQDVSFPEKEYRIGASMLHCLSAGRAKRNGAFFRRGIHRKTEQHTAVVLSESHSAWQDEGFGKGQCDEGICRR